MWLDSGLLNVVFRFTWETANICWGGVGPFLCAILRFVLHAFVFRFHKGTLSNHPSCCAASSAQKLEYLPAARDGGLRVVLQNSPRQRHRVGFKSGRLHELTKVPVKARFIHVMAAARAREIPDQDRAPSQGQEVATRSAPNKLVSPNPEADRIRKLVSAYAITIARPVGQEPTDEELQEILSQHQADDPIDNVDEALNCGFLKPDAP